jgi:putative transposase
VQRLARETGWGYSCTLGELKYLGIGTVNRSAGINILREAGLEPGPKRGVGTWSDFLYLHIATLWASDFLTVKTWTTRGIVDRSVLFFIHPGTRKGHIGDVSANPDAKWMQRKAGNASTMRMEELGHPVSHLIIDHDGKYAKAFDLIFETAGAKVHRVGLRAPILNALSERFAQSMRVVCLDHFVFCGDKHPRRVLIE